MARQVLVARLLDGLSSVTLRSLILQLLVVLLCTPEGMQQFIALRQTTWEQLEFDPMLHLGGYRRLVLWASKPVVPALMGPLHHVMALAAAWHSIIEMRQAIEVALVARCSRMSDSDGPCMVVVRCMRELLHSVHLLQTVACMPDHGLNSDVLEFSRLQLANPVSQMCRTAYPFSVAHAKLLGAAGFWRVTLAVVSATAVRTSRYETRIQVPDRSCHTHLMLKLSLHLRCAAFSLR